MTIQTIPGGLWIPPAHLSAAAVPALGPMTVVLNAAANFNAVVFQVPKTGTLDLFEYRQDSNSNTPDNGLRFSFQGVDASFNPDNTDDEFAVVNSGFGTPAWLVPSGYMGAGGTGSGAKRSVTKGDWLACVIKFESFVAADNVSMSIANQPSTSAASYDPQIRYALTTNNSGTTWIKVTGYPTIALKYDDGTYAVIDWPWLPALNINTRTFNNGSTPDERGLLFQVPFPARIAGMWVRSDLDNAGDVVLYDSASSVIASFSLTTAMRFANGGSNFRVYFPTPVNLTANTNYRLSILPTSASNLSIYDFDVATAAILAGMDGGSTWMSTERTNAGAWTDVTTNRPYMGIILDGFDDAASGGGGEHSAVF